MEIKGYSLAILGDSGVGKTCFAMRFCGENFNEENKEKLKPTRGAEYFQRIFYYNKESIKIDIYDISGDKKYENVSKYLYRNVRSIILMYNIYDSKTLDHLKYFLDNIGRISVENPSIFIVGNYNDKAKFEREVNDAKLSEYKIYEVSKFYKISALNSQDKDFKNILDDITRRIIDSGKWYETKLFKDLGDLNSVENENKNEKFKKDLKSFNKEKKPHYLRCKSCEKLFIIKFKTIFNEINFICDKCKINQIIKIADINRYIEDISNRINCQMCLKKIDSKYKLVYCTTCKKYFCPSCEKSHDKKFKLKKDDNSSHYKCPYYLMDIECLEDGQKNIGHCKKCEISFCTRCFSRHKQHEITYFDDFVEQLVNENKEKINKEREIINSVKDNCQDCINTIKKIFDDFINIKEKEIKLKTDLVNQLGFIQYNYQLIETVRKFRYLTEIKYDKNSLWTQKLMDLFEILHSPIQIKNINIQKKEYNTPSRIELGYNNKKEGANKKQITDFCSMNNDKYIGITFSDGTLELYNDFIQDKVPLSIFPIFDNKDIESIRKSNRNVNSFLLCAENIIKNIEFYDNYKNYKTIKEIVDKEDKVFIFTLEFNDCIIAIDSLNRIYLFDRESKKVGEITNCIDLLGKKQIFSLNEISNNKFYITFNKKEDNISRISAGRPNLNYGFDELAFDAEDNNFNKTIINIGTKIISIDNLKVVNQYLLPDKEEVLGAIHDSVILIRDDVYNSIILFDANSYKIIKRFYWELEGKPVFLDIINRRAKIVDFILVDENFNIFQNIFDEEAKNITQISGVKNIEDGYKIYVNNFNRGKIINNPYKSIVNYIGDNKFIVVNY